MIRSVCCSVMVEFWATNSVMSVRVSYPRLIRVNHAALSLVVGLRRARIYARFYFRMTARDGVRLTTCDSDDSISGREGARDSTVS